MFTFTTQKAEKTYHSNLFCVRVELHVCECVYACVYVNVYVYMHIEIEMYMLCNCSCPSEASPLLLGCAADMLCF